MLFQVIYCLDNNINMFNCLAKQDNGGSRAPYKGSVFLKSLTFGSSRGLEWVSFPAWVSDWRPNPLRVVMSTSFNQTSVGIVSTTRDSCCQGVSVVKHGYFHVRQSYTSASTNGRPAHLVLGHLAPSGRCPGGQCLMGHPVRLHCPGTVRDPGIRRLHPQASPSLCQSSLSIPVYLLNVIS